MFVLTPPSSHRQIAEQVAAAGLPVFCKKPLGMDEGETQSMVDATAAVPTAVGFTMRFHLVRTALVRSTWRTALESVRCVPTDWRGSPPRRAEEATALLLSPRWR